MARYSESMIPTSALVRLAGATAPEKGDHAPQAHQRPHPFEQQKAPLRLDHRYHAEHGRTYEVHHRIREVRRPYEPELVGGVGREDGESTENRYHLQHEGTSGDDETAGPATISEGWLRSGKESQSLCGSGFFELANEHGFCRAHARLFRELLDGDAYLLVTASVFGNAQVERYPTPGVDSKGASAHASVLFPEPQLVVLVLPGPRQAPDLQLRAGVGIRLTQLQLTAGTWREIGSLQGGRGNLVLTEEPGRVQQRSKHGERCDDRRRCHKRNPACPGAWQTSHDAALELGRRGLRIVREVDEAFVDEAEVLCLLPTRRAPLEVLLHLSTLFGREGPHHVRPDEVPDLLVLAHGPLTHPRPRACTRAGRAALLWSCSSRSPGACWCGGRSRSARGLGSRQGSAPPCGSERVARAPRPRRSSGRARR